MLKLCTVQADRRSFDRNGLVPGLYECGRWNEYKEKTKAFFQAVKSLGVDKIFLIQIGNHREFPDRYVPMQEAQEEIAEEMEDVIMTSRLFRTFRDRGLMKDSFHYKQEAYNLVGEEAGARTGEILTKEAGKTKL